MSFSRMNRKEGFTLIELLVVISIIGLLSSVVLAAISTARDRGSVAAGQTFEGHTYAGRFDSVVGRWTFDDVITGGTTSNDSSGNGNTGTISNTSGVYPTNTTNNNQGQSVFVDNSVAAIDDINMGTVSSLALTTGSIAAWIKAAPVQSYGNYGAAAIAMKDDSSYKSYGLYLFDPAGGTNLGRLAIKNGPGNIGSNWIYDNAGPALNDNKWHYVAISFQSGVANSLHFYIDGRLTSTYAGTYTIPAGNGSFSVGDGGPRGAYGYQGYIDNLVVYSNVITAQEVQEQYAEGLKTHHIAEK